MKKEKIYIRIDKVYLDFMNDCKRAIDVSLTDILHCILTDYFSLLCAGVIHPTEKILEILQSKKP